MMTIDYEHCTGCEACAQRCPKQCITMIPGEFGFLYPKIDRVKCVDCHLCEKVCPINKDRQELPNQAAYAAVHQDKQILLNSTSGGAFTALAMAVLNNHGIVYGVSMDDFIVQHVRIDSAKDLAGLRGSKYLQSRIGRVFLQAEQDLKTGRKVLFSGTPCQIDGLKQFLCKDYDNLLTVDIVCHGVGSQAYFDKFISSVRELEPQVREIKFRSKRFSGWSVTSGALVLGENGKESYKPFYNHEQYYYRFFLEGSIYRRSCYSCKYANLNRPGDCTLGDFWGVERLRLPINTYNGCSLIIANSSKGAQMLDALSELKLVPVPIEEAIKGNEQLLYPSKLTGTRVVRLNDFETKTGNEIASSYRTTEKKQILRGTLKKCVPYSLKTIIRSLRKK